MSELFNQGGIVMLLIAGVSVAAWLLAFGTWRIAKLMLTELTEGISHKSRRGKNKLIFENELARLEGSLNLLAGLAAALPLLGLLGTVLGMLVTFNVIQSHGTGRPCLLANGIRQALLTTQAGLLTALPVLFFHHLISMRLKKIDCELNVAFHGSDTLRKNDVQENIKT